MGIASQQFEGISTNIPGVYTKSEFPPNSGGAGAVTNVVAIIGQSLAGIPYNATDKDDPEKVNVISSSAQAFDVLRGGNGYYMSEFFLTPTKDPSLNTPSQVLFFRVDPATQASKTIQDGSSNDIIDLVSTRYGTIGNQVSRKVEAATTLGHKVTIKFQGNIIAEEDDVGFEYLAIQYVGAGTAAAMTINATSLAVTVTGAPTDDLSLTFIDYPTLGELVAFISEQPNYTCTLIGSSNAKTTTFDAVTAQDIKTAEYTAVAHVEALIQFFNNNSQGEIEASLHAAAVRTDVANDSNFVYLASGANGSVTSTDWANTLELMKKFRINHILAATGDPAIQAMVDAHVVEMSKIENKRNRSAGSGSAAGNNITTKISEAKALNSARFEYHFTPFSRYDAINDNAVTEFAPFFGAALTAGIRFGNDVTISSTFKLINVLKLGESYSDPQAKQIIGSGGTLFDSEERGFVVKHNVTTFQGSNLILNLPSMLRTADAITLDSQAVITQRIADLKKAPNALVIETLKNFLITNLLPKYRDEIGWLTDDPINGEPAFKDVEFALYGDRFDFSFTGIIPAPLHFVFIKQKFVITGSAGA